jgi:hypothetical protein
MNDDTPAVDTFEDAVRAVISRYANARLLTVAEVVGVLHIIAADMIRSNLHPEEDHDL